jgi:hypothetical protein
MVIIRTVEEKAPADILRSSAQPDPLEALISRIEGE